MSSIPDRRRMPLRALAVALLVPALAGAGGAPPLDRRIDIDLVDAGADQVFASFASVVSGELDLAPALADRKLSIRLHNVHVRTALDAACETLGCRWRLEGAEAAGAKARLIVSERLAGAPASPPPALAAKLEERISLDLDDAPMETVLGSFAHILGAELDLDPRLAGGEVSIRLTDVEVGDGLTAVLGEAWTWGIEELPDGRRLVIRRRPR